jgi:hypothetical protein
VTRINKFLYQVQHNETVTLGISAVTVSEEGATFAVDGQAIDPGGPPRSFKFDATRPVGEEHEGVLVVSFAGVGPGATMARFETHLTGSNGGDFSGPTIFRDDVLHRAEVSFEVI